MPPGGLLPPQRGSFAWRWIHFAPRGGILAPKLPRFCPWGGILHPPGMGFAPGGVFRPRWGWIWALEEESFAPAGGKTPEGGVYALGGGQLHPSSSIFTLGGYLCTWGG